MLAFDELAERYIGIWNEKDPVNRLGRLRPCGQLMPAISTRSWRPRVGARLLQRLQRRRLNSPISSFDWWDRSTVIIVSFASPGSLASKARKRWSWASML